MKPAKYASLSARKTAAPAVIPLFAGIPTRKGGFTLLEVLVVVVIIGILSTLGYSSLTEIIFTNRAKETAQTIRTFAERALAEGKRQNGEVELNLSQNSIQYTTESNTVVSAALSAGFTGRDEEPNCISGDIVSFNGGATSKPAIGISRIVKTNSESEEGYFAACDAKNYCGAAVKVKSKNSFVACIKKGKSSNWEVL